MIINLCFHGIGAIRREREPGESRYWVVRDQFHRMLDALRDVSDVDLSFDDGNLSDHTVAMPALVERGLTATFFPLAGRLDDPESLNGAGLRDLHDAGMRIGSHGWSHVSWRGLTDLEARRELIDARAALEEASGATITEAALPLGQYDRRLIRRLGAAHYTAVFTSDRFPTRPTSWLRARYSVTGDDTADSIMTIARHRMGIADATQLGKSLVKRVR